MSPVVKKKHKNFSISGQTLSLIHICVVKELVENACDAGATAITVEIKDGGTTFIRVTDNGSGIKKNEVKKAFFRHATSKIRGVEDLSRIHSLGLSLIHI